MPVFGSLCDIWGARTRLFGHANSFVLQCETPVEFAVVNQHRLVGELLLTGLAEWCGSVAEWGRCDERGWCIEECCMSMGDSRVAGAIIGPMLLGGLKNSFRANFVDALRMPDVRLIRG